jgi:hypothetical protein
VPGPIGVYFHWLRINSGNGTAEDIDVYGKPAVEMSLESGDRSVTMIPVKLFVVWSASFQVLAIYNC